ncbi:alpha/beta hydrolase family protein [Pedobacter montanisoli]|uniref:Alpha/beta hydrolase n=1 Tax=Pedobacter montanisoli TaxID=2923277 RepID=A0ABS9ZWU0_9SPHI|nr:alpha/beta hydrolase [Pedobacter montanisoli]MCJ0742781.1 alpha/beta hydrolase [Pedobacter montanisoli]
MSLHQEQFSIIGASEKPIYGDLTYNPKNSNMPLVIFIHGFKGFKDWGAHNLVAKHFVQNGYRYLKFNLSHSGVDQENPNDVSDLEAFASNTFSKEMTDVDIIIKHAVNYLGVDKVFLIGHSRGGGLSILQAANNPYVGGLITWSSIADFSSLWKKEQEKKWHRTGKIEVINARTKEKMPLNVTLLEDFEENQDKLNILAAAKQLNIPWLIIQGDNDVNVPFETAEKLANANPASRLLKIKDANHVFGAFHPYIGDSLPAHLFEVCEKSLTFLNSIEK